LAAIQSPGTADTDASLLEAFLQEAYSEKTTGVKRRQLTTGKVLGLLRKRRAQAKLNRPSDLLELTDLTEGPAEGAGQATTD